MSEQLPENPNQLETPQQDRVSIAVGVLASNDTLAHEHTEAQTPSESLDTVYRAKFEHKRDHLESVKEDREARLGQKRDRAEQMAQKYEERKGHPPTPEWLASFSAPAEQGVRHIKGQLEFLRPTSEADIAYRNKVVTELPSKIREAAPADLPLRFHGTPIYTARDVFASKGLSSSVDRLGVETSYDVSDQVSVTTPATVETTLNSYTGLTEQDCYVPAGCVFVLLPSTQIDANAGASMLMSNVDFASHPEQLFAVMTSEENIDMVQKWAQDAGIDAGKIVEFFEFADKLSEVKSSFERGAARAEDYAQYLKQGKIPEKDMGDQLYDAESRKAGWDSPERVQKVVEGYVTRGAKILDIGIGTGQAIKGYVEKGATVIGLDHDEQMLNAARAVSGDSSSLRLADINQPLPISDLNGQVDVAQAVGVLEFAQDIENVLKQVHVSLKQDGVFAFTTESLEEGGPITDQSTHYPESGITVYRHSPEEIRQLLQETGYKLLTEEAYGAYQHGDIADDKVPYRLYLAQKN